MQGKCLAALLFGLVLCTGTGFAQGRSNGVLEDPVRLVEVAREEASRGNHETALAFYVRAIAYKADDAPTLVGAGNEALILRDYDAAFGFLRRAIQIDPRNGPARLSYARALTLTNQPRQAMTVFEQAASLGVAAADIAMDRGLARDLIGDQDRAQADYRLYLTAHPHDGAVSQRLALSLAISGNRKAALAIIQPLAARDSAGDVQRTLAFVQALTGDAAQARRIAARNMPADQADAFSSFFDRLAALDSAEKAAAVHLGRLPQSTMNGQSRIAAQNTATAPAAPPPAKPPIAMPPAAVAIMPSPADTPAAPAPTVRKDARKARQAEETKEARAAKEAAQSRQKALADARDALIADECGTASSRKAAQCRANINALERRCASGRKTAECLDYSTRLETAGKPRPAPAPAQDKPATRAEITAARADGTLLMNDCDGVVGKAGLQCRADARSLERRCSGSDAPATAECKAYADRLAEARKGAPAAKGSKASAVKKADAKAGPRHWVQVASGKHRADLPKAWDAVQRKSRALLGNRSAWVMSAGATNRLLVGPFDDADDAQALVNRLSGAGISAFRWSSKAGDDVDRLDGK